MNEKTSSFGQMNIKPVSNLLASNAPIISDPSNLQNDDAVVVIEDARSSEDAYNLAWGPRCLNDPDRLERPAIINRAFQGRV